MPIVGSMAAGGDDGLALNLPEAHSVKESQRDPILCGESGLASRWQVGWDAFRL